ncbi:unnamed protein product [Angiostrongylus costaricensis]|uniref:Secreted protein n=1 Tax=Angiostrongylus costaricensis TaxID=334426 RepID=A0A0R3PWL3_ANGCS|nr:unnamed protein product [Angiostrongylus costaricensis]
MVIIDDDRLNHFLRVIAVLGQLPRQEGLSPPFMSLYALPATTLICLATESTIFVSCRYHCRSNYGSRFSVHSRPRLVLVGNRWDHV